MFAFKNTMLYLDEILMSAKKEFTRYVILLSVIHNKRYLTWHIVDDLLDCYHHPTLGCGALFATITDERVLVRCVGAHIFISIGK